MHSILLAIIAATLFVGSVVAVRIKSPPTKAVPLLATEQISTTHILTETPSATPTLITTHTPIPTIFKVEKNITPTPSSTYSIPTITPDSGKATQLSFVYPGARLISKTNNLEIYETDEDATTVGKWYKDMFFQQSYNVKNYISSVTNGIAQIAISVNNESSSLNITIHQSPDSLTTIEIST